jgi:2-amino-4-hydroxy-6-hydroxymethyldihydropteridine diphosphokinase
VQVSSIINTAPMGYHEQPEFLNAVLLMKSRLAPIRLLREMRALELKLGRQDRPRWHEREIDLDLLFWDDFVYVSDEITIPHPGIPLRKFVLEPLAEIAPKFVHPRLGKTVEQLLEHLLQQEQESRRKV